MLASVEALTRTKLGILGDVNELLLVLPPRQDEN
jgi:hypothetical protein